MIGTVSHCDWRALAERVRSEVGQVDALIVDAPYSETTHSGHDDGAMTTNRGADYAARVLAKGSAAGRTVAGYGVAERRTINYACWTPDDVAAFCAAWLPLTRGWFCTLTDHILARAWEASLKEGYRYVFAPIACVESGSRVRLLGDGPAQWSTFLVVARPRDGAWLAERKARRDARGAKCALPGAYTAHEQGKDVPGGKPLALMTQIVEDYSEPGELVCDPCAGAGTTLLAAKLLGRRFIGGDISREHVAIAEERLRDLPTADRKGTLALPFGDR